MSVEWYDSFPLGKGGTKNEERGSSRKPYRITTADFPTLLRYLLTGGYIGGNCPKCGRDGAVLNCGDTQWVVCREHRLRCYIGTGYYDEFFDTATKEYIDESESVSEMTDVSFLMHPRQVEGTLLHLAASCSQQTRRFIAKPCSIGARALVKIVEFFLYFPVGKPAHREERTEIEWSEYFTNKMPREFSEKSRLNEDELPF